MGLYITCSNCATRLRVRDGPEGRPVTCPTCRTKQPVDTEGRAAEGPVRADDAARVRDGKLRSQIFLSYTCLRVGMGVMALVLPLVLLVGGWAYGTSPQDSMSAYYHTPVRDFFVGILFALGSFLYLYKGFSRQENYALNVAGVLAILIAIVPTDPTSNEPVALSLTAWLHRLFGVLFFFAIAYVCIFRAADTAPFIATSARSKFYSRTYKLLGICMIVVPGAVYFLAKYHQRDLTDDRRMIIFLLEWAAIWVFGAYWLLKSKEIKDSQADQRAPLRERDRIRVQDHPAEGKDSKQRVDKGVKGR